MVDYEVVILGSGPAGLQAAIHAARSKVSVLVLGRREKSSIANAEMENYFGLKSVNGMELLQTGIDQAEKSGATVVEEDAIKTSRIDEKTLLVKSESGVEYRCRAIIFTLGVTRNSLNLPGEKALVGKGVSYCVDCDANFYKGRSVVITGNGSAAVSGALTLSEYSPEVSLIADDISVDERLLKQLEAGNVRVFSNSKIVEIRGEEKLSSVVLNDGTEIETEGLFVELGAKGALELAGFLGIEMDDSFKFIAVNRKQETNVPGIYAAGDICGQPWQVAKAVGEGCIAGLEAAKYSRKLR